MKKWLGTIGSILLAGVLTASVGCFADDDKDKQYSITFIQEGFSDMKFWVDAGESFEQVPAPKKVEGYTVAWDKTEFDNVTKNIVVTAVATPNDYLITYFLSEEDGEHLDGEYTQTVTFDAQYTLPTPTRYGYSFTGWTDGKNTLQQNGEWKIAKDVTLSPTWADNSYTITFLQNGNSETYRLECGDVLSEENIPELLPVEGYEVSWSVQNFSTINQNTTVTVVKNPKTFTVQYLLGDGETLEGDNSDAFLFGSEYALKIPEKTGYTFQYWKQENNQPLLSKGTWSIAHDVKLTAQWTQNDNLITFLHADGTEETRTVKTGETLVDIPKPNPLPGYTVEWSVKDFSSITGAMTVEAIPTPCAYKVTYSVPEDKQVDKTEVMITYTEDYTLATPTRYGYSFVGWETPDGKMLDQTGKWSVIGDVTLTAKWQDNYYVITFVHADNSTEKVLVEKGDVLDKAPTCKQIPGYTTSWSVTDFSTITSSTTVHAKKDALRYTVTYSLSAGESISGDKEVGVTFGSAYTLEKPKTLDNDLAFKHWKNAVTGEIVPLKGTWKIAGNVTLVAVWEESGDWTKNY